MWAKCVVTYLIDAFSPNILDLIVFVCEVSLFALNSIVNASVLAF